MWKAIGSIHSGDTRSIRSNRSTDKDHLEHFHLSNKSKSSISQNGFDRDQSFRHHRLNQTKDHSFG
jgi:hypothetical protein